MSRLGSRPRVPLWHTAVLILVVLGFSALSYLTTLRPSRGGRGAKAAAGHPGAMLATYLATALFEWLIFAFTFWGDRRYLGARIRDRIRGRWANAAEFWRDVAIALGLWVALSSVGALAQFLHPSGAKVVEQLLPRSPGEMLLWVFLAASAGFCEEYVFRGYLQQQALALTGSAWAAIVAQAAVFGFGHGYQGGVLMAVIFIYGLGFGAVAQWRKSLRPGMLGHGWIDFFSGLLGFVEHLRHRL
ncbi:MAG TPA: CPBP family intramembrane glutamic endopeptidase [Candidatus Acidoferrales bacterium]|nr:CPBP family intramembrane glutamic endopeptidase [Candidatus Acidoferrales bacterium]